MSLSKFSNSADPQHSQIETEIVNAEQDYLVVIIDVQCHAIDGTTWIGKKELRIRMRQT
jgi:hypothetical protein